MPKGIGSIHLDEREQTKKRILDTLKEYGRLTWSEIVERSKLSSATISKYLKRLVKEGEINRWQDPNTYPPNVYYMLTPRGERTLNRYEELIHIGKVIIETPFFVKGLFVDEMGAPTKTAENWLNFLGRMYRGYLKEHDKYRGMVVPLKFLKDVEKQELDEIIVYAVLPRKEFQDVYNRIQERFKTTEEKNKVARKMFRSGLKAIKEAFENLLEEWKQEYNLD